MTSQPLETIFNKGLKKAESFRDQILKSYQKAKKLHPAYYHAITLSATLLLSAYAVVTLQQGEALKTKADILMAQKEIKNRINNQQISEREKRNELENTIAELKATIIKLCPSNATFNGDECVCKNGYGSTYDKKFCIAIPKNAYHVGTITDTWLCNDGYAEVHNKCVPMKKAIITTNTEKTKPSNTPQKKAISADDREKSYKAYIKSMSVWMRFLKRGTITQQAFENYEQIARDKYEETTGETLIIKP